MSLRGFLKDCGAWEFSPKGCGYMEGEVIRCADELSWMVKGNEYKKPVDLVMIIIISLFN